MNSFTSSYVPEIVQTGALHTPASGRNNQLSKASFLSQLLRNHNPKVGHHQKLESRQLFLNHLSYGKVKVCCHRHMTTRQYSTILSSSTKVISIQNRSQLLPSVLLWSFEHRTPTYRPWFTTYVIPAPIQMIMAVNAYEKLVYRLNIPRCHDVQYLTSYQSLHASQNHSSWKLFYSLSPCTKCRLVSVTE